MKKLIQEGIGASRPRELPLTCAGTLGLVTYKDIDFFVLRLMQIELEARVTARE